MFSNRIQSVPNKIIKNIFGNLDDETFRPNSLIKLVDGFDYFAGIKLYKELNSSFISIFSERILSLQTIHSHFVRFTANYDIVPLFLPFQKFIYFSHSKQHLFGIFYLIH